MFSQVTLIVESALAHAGTVVSEGEVVIGFSPSERLSGGENGSLNFLWLVTHHSGLAPARLILALLAVGASIGSLIVHLEDHVIATGFGLG